MTSPSKFLTLPAVVSAVGLSAGTVSSAAEPTTAELMQQIQQLQAKVQTLEAQQSQALNAHDVDATIDSVLRDADKRSQMLQMEGFTAGWTQKRGFVIQDASGDWVLHPNMQFQFRSTTNWRIDGKHGLSDSDWENGFEIRRMRFGFDGNAFDPRLAYYFLWDANSDGGGVTLNQAWVRYFFNDDFAVRVGQIVNPAFHEQVTSSRRQLAADRSMVNSLITGSNEALSQAVTIMYAPREGPLFIEGGIEDGFLSGNTDYLDPNEGGSSDWGVTGRINIYAMGNHADYEDFSALKDQTDLLVFGLGGDITQTNDVTAYLHTVDVQYENTGGLSVYAAYLANYVRDEGADDSTYNWGALGQVGYLFTPDWEGFARYGYTHFDESVVGPDEREEFHEITVGANWFVAGGHNCKVTLDVTYLPNGAPTDIEGLGVLAGDDDEYIFRGQFQLLL